LGTNYYIAGKVNSDDPKDHIGKISAWRGGSIFIWAMSPFFLNILIESHKYCETSGEKEKIIENEYQELFTLKEFIAIVEKCTEQDCYSIGQRFS